MGDEGRFVHHELRTTDPKAAGRFYGELLGWQVIEHPFGVTFRAGDWAVAGASPVKPGIPPHWTGFVKVGDVDAVAKAAEDAGGIVTAPPMDVPALGRLSVVLDAQRAVVGFVSEGRVPSGGTVPYFGWNELHTPDVPGAAAFYRATAGWEQRAGTFLDADGGAVAKIRATAPGPPAYWLPYLSVGEVAPVVARAVELGATVDADGLIRDPQGAVVALRER
jgi:predicted enzyme related to lactoylglutathione lyase